jgi:hypothetical protein
VRILLKVTVKGIKASNLSPAIKNHKKEADQVQAQIVAHKQSNLLEEKIVQK